MAGALSLAAQGAFARRWMADLPATGEMTVAAWVRPGYPAQGYGPVVYLGSGAGGGDRFEFGFGPDNIYPVITDKQSHSGAVLYVAGMRGLIPEGEWGHIAVAAGPSGATTYVNGKPIIETAYAGRFDFDAPDI